MALAISLAFLLFFHTCSLSQGENFLFNGFNGSDGNLKLEGASILKPSGMIKLTNATRGVVGHVGHAFYSKPITMYEKNSSSFPNASSFSTEIVFAIVSPSSGSGGFGLAFTLSPSPSFPGAEAGHYFGIFSSSNDNNSSNHILAVEFDTVNGYNESLNTNGNHVGIDINSVYSEASEPAAYYTTGSHKEEVKMESGDLIHAWIDYDGEAQLLNVTISPINKGKPTKPLLSYGIDLSSVLQETMYAGFSASTGDNQSSSHYIIAWSFAVNGTARSLNLIDLPIPPKEKSSSSSYSPPIKALIVALSVLVFLLSSSYIS
ncbi:hypothetical protein ABKV19_021590 [Rosa sericea]